TAGVVYSADFYPSIGASLTGLPVETITLPTSPAIKSMSITRKVDQSSPLLFKNCCAGTHYKTVILGMRKSAGNTTGGTYYQITLTEVQVTYISHNPNGTDTYAMSFSQSTSNLPASAGLLA